jgi:hypothetical protein
MVQPSVRDRLVAPVRHLVAKPNRCRAELTNDFAPHFERRTEHPGVTNGHYQPHLKLTSRRVGIRDGNHRGRSIGVPPMQADFASLLNARFADLTWAGGS